MILVIGLINLNNKGVSPYRNKQERASIILRLQLLIFFKVVLCVTGIGGISFYKE